ncbi:MAG: hypothetical protein DHS80DRAFT_26180 [Piptocephalis tieghemiana]|nr:MAG: hypothetical protein DHS80DRAFT_26180 [Piptocephalis tieghemiana]
MHLSHSTCLAILLCAMTSLVTVTSSPTSNDEHHPNPRFQTNPTPDNNIPSLASLPSLLEPDDPLYSSDDDDTSSVSTENAPVNGDPRLLREMPGTNQRARPPARPSVIMEFKHFKESYNSYAKKSIVSLASVSPGTHGLSQKDLRPPVTDEEAVKSRIAWSNSTRRFLAQIHNFIEKMGRLNLDSKKEIGSFLKYSTLYLYVIPELHEHVIESLRPITLRKKRSIKPPKELDIAKRQRLALLGNPPQITGKDYAFLLRKKTFPNLSLLDQVFTRIHAIKDSILLLLNVEQLRHIIRKMKNNPSNKVKLHTPPELENAMKFFESVNAYRSLHESFEDYPSLQDSISWRSFMIDPRNLRKKLLAEDPNPKDVNGMFEHTIPMLNDCAILLRSFIQSQKNEILKNLCSIGRAHVEFRKRVLDKYPMPNPEGGNHNHPVLQVHQV